MADYLWSMTLVCQPHIYKVEWLTQEPINILTMELVHDIALLCFVIILYQVYRRLTGPSIAHIPGPDPESLLLGKFHVPLAKLSAKANCTIR